jgi:curli production assembly/transport component CsgE
MNQYCAGILLFMLSLVVKAGNDIEIGGLIVDQTISRVGLIFYEELIHGWDVSDQSATITVRERPDIRAGNIIWIEVEDEVVFQDRIGTRPTGIEERAEAAREMVESYLQQNKEALRGLEVY